MSFLERMLDQQFKAENNLPTNGFWMHNGPEEEIDFVIDEVDLTNDTIIARVVNHTNERLIGKELIFNPNTPFIANVPKTKQSYFRLYAYPSDAVTGARFDIKVLRS